MMPTLKGKYNIKAVSKMLGIQPSTLRAWERRYHIVAPKRNDAGHRLYTEEHIQILKWLIDQVNKGIAIGQAVQILERNRLQNHNEIEMAYNKEMLLVDDILHSLLKFDEVKASAFVNEAFSIYPIEKVITHIFLEITKQLEKLEGTNQVTMVQMQYVESFLGTRIGMIYHNAYVPKSSALQSVFAFCGPGEVQALQLFILTVYLRLKGYQTIYIGTGLQEEKINETIVQLEPDYVVISCLQMKHVQDTVHLAQSLQTQHEKLSIALLGSAITHISTDQPFESEYVFIGSTKEEWDEWLKMSE
ncbi:MerR family transcriptional regulator [Bacillus cytotoxicus]|nr:MerR family transcriptional regulator [Bacillus cytotoxicus]AWC40440.1 MerR family transcriptional regulator [Bacillus cytotoxicus]AWC48371.1 MerR family transcriptional regulator [Bacillus cytotoxicus]AWC52241.1 MerR family transcriptional regulator [Bacillus cytotoxicus]AWC56376.1 MerR family transcriptional regulator [Bacillus cytotoxicus]